MAYNKQLEERIEDVFILKSIPHVTKHMFGGSVVMVDDKMCIGVMNDQVLARVHPDQIEELLKIDGVGRMTMGQRTMKGYLAIDMDAVEEDGAIEFWVDKCMEYNPIAKRSKKK